MEVRRLAALTAVVMVLPSIFVAAALPVSAATTPWPCGAPLGIAAERRADAVLAPVADAEYDLVDTLRMPGAQRSPETVLSFGGRLALVAEVKVDQGSNFTWGVFVRFHSNDTGWNSTQVWLSSPNTTSYYPAGVHIRPSAAVWQDRLWVAWDGAGSEQAGPNDRLILLRSVDANGTADATRIASDTDPARANQHPFLLALADKLVLAYASAANETDSSENHIVVRTFDGSAFTPSVTLSNVSDGWSDGLPLVVADPAGALFAVWSSSNLTGAASRLMFSRTVGGVWTEAVPLAALGQSPASIPGGVFYQGKFFAAYATDNIADINGTDFEVFWRNFDPATGLWSSAQSLNPQPSNGDDLDPELRIIGGKLYASWSTNEDAYYSHGSDPDPVYRVFDGAALGPLLELSSANDRAFDGTPHFVQVGGHLYAHWMWQPPPEPGAPRGDAREGIRLVQRPPQWYDALNATYLIQSVSENGSSDLRVWVRNVANIGVAGDFVVRLPDGSVYPLSPLGEAYSVWAPVERDTPDFEVLACGKPLPVSPERASVIGIPVNYDGLLLVAIVSAAVVGAAALIYRSRGTR